MERHRSLNPSSHTPICVRRKAATSRGIETVNRIHHGIITLLDKIQNVNTAIRVPPCDCDRNSQVRLNQVFLRDLGGARARLHYLEQVRLPPGREPRNPADFLHVHVEWIVASVLITVSGSSRITNPAASIAASKG
jgi:hypothetical protein